MANEYKLKYSGQEIDNRLAQVENKIDKTSISLGIHTDGLVYIFVNGSPQGNGLDIKADVIEGDVFGYVDENNNIVLQGKLDDGTYAVKYEMEDGSTIDIGELKFSYTVKNTLTNCTNSNKATSVANGNSYSATITANSGYELKSVTVTMGGQSVSASGGNISIASVTGDIVITAIAEAAAPKNVLPTSINADGTLYVGTNGEKGYKTGTRISGSSGNETTQSGCMVTGFIAAQSGEKVVVENITLNSTSGNNVLCFYDASFAKVGNTTMGGSLVEQPSDGVYVIKPDSITNYASVRYIRFSCGTISANTIVTVQKI